MPKFEIGQLIENEQESVIITGILRYEGNLRNTDGVRDTIYFRKVDSNLSTKLSRREFVEKFC